MITAEIEGTIKGDLYRAVCAAAPCRGSARTVALADWTPEIGQAVAVADVHDRLVHANAVTEDLPLMPTHMGYQKTWRNATLTTDL